MTITMGILHPGSMGSSVAAAAKTAGADVLWCSAGRSAATRRRAEADGLREVGDLAQLVAESEVLISVCPPASALELAESVATLGFSGLYVDANAVSPATVRVIVDRLRSGGADVVDGGIVGPPAREGRRTILYLSGKSAARVEALFSGSAVSPHVVGPEPGQASAVKMAFAAWTKGTAALLLAIAAVAESEGVSAGLQHAWTQMAPDLIERLPATAHGVAPKAWRWSGEMREIAATFEAAGLPGGFHRGAADIYERLARFQTGEVDAERVIAALASPRRS
jgi:3-hydroxyisobutyrate dehydrogenase-like beta-hydroxyacid dehydrogenase